MAGTGSENGVYVVKNLNFDHTAGPPHAGILTANGDLVIGSTANPNIAALKGRITSPLGTINVGYAAPNITIDLVGGSTGIDSIGVDATSGGGTNPVLPTAAGLVVVNGARVAAGTNPIRSVSTSPSVYQIQVQTSQAIAAADATKVGLANFNSTQFSVDANGFVSIVGGGFTWTDVTTATQTLAVENGYLTDRGAGVVYTLPATASIGDEIRIVGKLGLATITPNANQQILMSSASGTVGATGTAIATNVGDCIELICTTSGASTVWRAANWVGNWTLN